MTYHVAIIGSGPSAFTPLRLYLKRIRIFMLICSRSCQPIWIVRGGVAPDHQQMKAVAKSYDKIADHQTFDSLVMLKSAIKLIANIKIILSFSDCCSQAETIVK